MTEDQIERHVELQVDRLDRRFLSSPMTQSQYDSAMREIRAWADVRLTLLSRQFPIT